MLDDIIEWMLIFLDMMMMRLWLYERMPYI